MEGHTLTLDRPRYGVRFWQRAFAGITPKVVVIVAALLLLRAIDTTIEQILLFVKTTDPERWAMRFWGNCRALLLQGVPMFVICVATANLGPQRGPKRAVALGIAVVVSTFMGALLRLDHLDHWQAAGPMLSSVLPRYTMLGAMLVIVAELYRSEVASNKGARQAEIDRAALETEMSEARLQALQAQIEPHFLFNTLANVRRLYAEDRALGREMLESLMRYLEVALPQMRDGETTLAREAALVESYLSLQRIRMGARLAFELDVPAALGAHRIPPMMLLTLVENAIKHGVGPVPNGGLIRVAARIESDRLELTVADTGAGFGSALGSGVGLSNLSARLAAEFGANARLDLANNEFGGATATIVLPFSRRA